jgi:hypothetical protein
MNKGSVSVFVLSPLPRLVSVFFGFKDTVEEDESVALLVADSTQKGYRLTLDWLKQNHTKFNRVWRLRVPFSASHRSFGEYVRANSNEPIIGRLLNCRSPETLDTEQIMCTGAVWEVDESDWPPFQTDSALTSIKFIAAEAMYGDRPFKVPDLLSGLTLFQTLVNDELVNNVQPVEALERVLTRFDLQPYFPRDTDYEKATKGWRQYLDLLSKKDLFPLSRSLATTEKLMEWMKRWTMNALSGPLLPCESHPLTNHVYCYRGELIKFNTTHEFLCKWATEKLNEAESELRELKREEMNQRSFTNARSQFIRSVYVKEALNPGKVTESEDENWCFFDLERPVKRKFLARLYGEEFADRLMDLTVADISTEAFTKNPYASVPLYDFFLNKVETEHSFTK